MATVSLLISVCAMQVRNSEWSWFSAAIDHPLAVQVLGIMFAFLVTNRVTRAIGRWWDGLMALNQMYRCMYDAFSFIMFNVKKEQKMLDIQLKRTDLPDEDIEWAQNRLQKLQDFSQKMIHWFSLMNALSLGTLKYGEEKCLENISCKYEDFEWLTGAKPRIKMKKSGSKMNALTDAFEKSTSKTFDQALTYIGEISPEEAALLGDVEDKMYLAIQWIMQALVIADAEKIIDMAPPILNRVYILVQDGIGAYLQAYKIAAVPYPYPLAQMMTMLMYAFVGLMPIIIEKFTKSLMLTPALSFLIILCYWGLNRVAREMENPFGEDPNDLPLHDFCASFNDNIEQMTVLQLKPEAELVFSFSDMCDPVNPRMGSKKPASFSAIPKKKAEDNSKVVDNSKSAKVSEDTSVSMETAEKPPEPSSAKNDGIVVRNPAQDNVQVQPRHGCPPQGSHASMDTSQVQPPCEGPSRGIHTAANQKSSEVVEWVEVNQQLEYLPRYNPPGCLPHAIDPGGGHRRAQDVYQAPQQPHRPFDHRDPRIVPNQASVTQGSPPLVHASDQSSLHSPRAQQQPRNATSIDNRWNSEQAPGSGGSMPAQPHDPHMNNDDYWAHLFLQRRLHIQTRMRSQATSVGSPQRGAQSHPNRQAQAAGHDVNSRNDLPYDATSSPKRMMPDGWHADEELC